MALSESHSEIVVDLLYLLGIAINVLIIVDMMSDGRALEICADRVRRLNDRRRVEKWVQGQANRVVFEAIQIVEETPNDLC